MVFYLIHSVSQEMGNRRLIQSLQYSDLIVGDANISANPVEIGESIRISCNIYNIGNADSNSNVVKYFLSVNQTFEPSDIYLGSDNVISLGSSGDSEENLYIDFPKVQGGNYYILFVVDVNNNVIESNENNNIISLPITVLAPDLSFLSFEAPSTVAVGSNVTLSCEVENIGNTTIPQSGVIIKYYISSNNNLDQNDIQIGSDVVSVPLGSLSSNSSEENCSAIIPSINNYSGYLLFKVDSDDIIYEENEQNNVVSKPISLVAPDLFSQGIITYNNVSPKISYQIKNGGNSASIHNFNVQYYLKKQGTTYSSLLMEENITDNINANGLIYKNVTFTLPNDISTSNFGTDYYIKIMIDSKNEVKEIFENNNISYSSDFSFGRPDLVVYEAVLNGTSSNSTSFPILKKSWTNPIEIKVKNNGSNSSAQTNMNMLFSSYSTYPSAQHSNYYLQSFTIPSVQAGGSQTFNYNIQVPNDVLSGITLIDSYKYFLIFDVDYNGYNIESNEGNNIKFLKFEYDNNNSIVGRMNNAKSKDNEEISNIDEKIRFEIYPNPSLNGLFRYSTNLKVNQMYLVDILGLKTEIKLDNLNILDLTKLNNGTYFLFVETESSDIIKKPIIINK